MRPESIRHTIVMYTDAVGGAQAVSMTITKTGLPLHIYWGDGQECWSSDFTAAISHTYQDKGTKKITILRPADGWELLTALTITNARLSKYQQGLKYLKNLKTLNMTGNALLPESSVDLVLSDLYDSIGRFTDRLACTVTLTGTTPAPSAAGAATVVLLTAAGWTMYTM